jgi:hypothetical protein
MYFLYLGLPKWKSRLWRKHMRKGILLAVIIGLATLVAPTAKAQAILVGQCIENATCWQGQTGVTP